MHAITVSNGSTRQSLKQCVRWQFILMLHTWAFLQNESMVTILYRTNKIDLGKDTTKLFWMNILETNSKIPWHVWSSLWISSIKTTQSGDYGNNPIGVCWIYIHFRAQYVHLTFTRPIPRWMRHGPINILHILWVKQFYIYNYNMVGDDTMHMICIMHGCSMHWCL